MKKQNIFISFSGGESSAYLLLRVLRTYPKDQYNILVCFANTGDENEETLRFIYRMQVYYDIDIVWLEAYVSPIKGRGVMPIVVDFKTCSRDGKPLLDQSSKLGHCAISVPHCTRDLKVRTMHKYVKSVFGHKYITLQGIRYDEQSRINWGKAKDNGWEYPLARWGVTKNTIRTFWGKHKDIHGFRLDLKEHQGNCNLCFKKSDKKLIQTIKEKPCLLIFRFTLELVSANDNHDQYRGSRTTMDLLELARDSKDIDNLSDFGGQCFCS